MIERNYSHDYALQLRNDPRIRQWCRNPDPISVEENERYWAKLDKERNHLFSILKDGEPRGVVSLTSIDRRNQTAEFNIMVDPNHHGQGIGKAALKDILRYGFQDLVLWNIWGETFEENIPAQRLFEKVGFQCDGIRREALRRNERRLNLKIYSMTRPQWTSLNPLSSS